MLDLLRTRRSVRTFENRPVASELVAALKEAVLRSPSSRSLNPWQFRFIVDKPLLAELAGCKPHGAAFLKNAPLGIVVCADPAICDVWVEDASIASLILHLTAHSLGLGSCWIQVRKRIYADGITAGDRVKKILDLPTRLEVESIIAVGYPKDVPPGHPEESLLRDRIIDQ